MFSKLFLMNSLFSDIHFPGTGSNPPVKILAGSPSQWRSMQSKNFTPLPNIFRFFLRQLNFLLNASSLPDWIEEIWTRVWDKTCFYVWAMKTFNWDLFLKFISLQRTGLVWLSSKHRKVHFKTKTNDKVKKTRIIKFTKQI